MLQELHKLFGDTLPDRNVFFATEGAPTRAPFNKEFGSWVNFCNDYARFVAKQKATKEAAAKVAPKVVPKAPAKAPAKEAK